jgi:PAS domain S-box-containing protein
METEKYSKETSELTPEGIAEKIHISYADYKALEQSYIEERRKMEDRIWLDQNVSRMDEVLRDNNDTSVRKFAENIINYMARLTGAVHGAFFVVDEEAQAVDAQAGYACTVETMVRTHFKMGEGLVGQVAKSKEMLALDDVETQVDSSLGRINASFLIIAPLVFNNAVYGVIELTILSKLKPRYLILIERVSRNIAAGLQSILNNQKTKQLLIEGLQQFEDFKIQTEKLEQLEQELQSARLQLQTKEEELVVLKSQSPDNQADIENNATAESWQQHNAQVDQLAQELNELKTLIQQKEAENQQLIHRLRTVEEVREAVDDVTQHEKFRQQAQELEQTKDFLKEIQWQLTQKEDQLTETLAKIKELETTTTIQNIPLHLNGEGNVEWQESVKDLQNQLINKELELKDAIARLNEELTEKLEVSARLEHLEGDLQKKTNEADVLRETLRWKDTEIENLDSEIAERKREIRKAQEEIEKLRNEIAHLQNNLSQPIDNEIVSNSTLSNDWVTERDNLLQTLANKDAELHYLQDAFKDLQKTLTEKESFWANFAAEKAQLQTEIADLKNQLNQPQITDNELLSGDINLSLQAKENQIAQLQQEIENLKNNWQEQEPLLQSLEAQKAGLKTEIDNLEFHKAEVVRLQAELVAQADNFQVLYEANENLKNEFASQIETWQQSNEQLKTEMQTQADNFQVLFAESEKLQMELGQNHQIAQAESEQLKIELATQANNFQTLLDENENLKTEYQNQLGIVQNIKAENEAIKIWLQERENDIEKSQTQVLELQKQITHLQAEIEAKNTELSEVRQQLRNLETEWREKVLENETLASKLSKKEDELLVSQYLLNQMQANPLANQEIERLQGELKKKENEIEHLKNNPIQVIDNEQVEQLKSELEALKANASQVVDNEEITKLKAELEALKANASQVVDNEEITKLKAELEALKANASQVVDNEEVTQLKAELEALKANASQVIDNEEVTQLKAELESLKANTSQVIDNEEVTQLKAEIAAQAEEIQNMRDYSQELSSLMADLRQKEADNEQLNQLVLELQAQLAQKPLVTNAENVSNESESAMWQKLQELEQIQQDLADKKNQIIEQAQWIDAQREALDTEQKQFSTLREEIQTREQENLLQMDKMRGQIHVLEVREGEMRQKEAELVNLFNKINSCFPAMEFDMDGDILSINNKLLLHLGMKVEDVIGHNFENFLLPEFLSSKDYKVIRQGLQMGVSQEIENMVMVGGKSRKLGVNATFVPIMGSDDKPYEVVMLAGHVATVEPPHRPEEYEGQNGAAVVAQPVVMNGSTVTATATKVDFESQEKLKAVYNSLVISELDLQGNILEINHQFEIFLGYDRQDVIGKAHSTIVDEIDRDSEEYQTIINNLRFGNYASQVLRYVGKEGEIVRLRSYFHAIKDEQENPIKVLVLSQFLN